MNLETSAYVLIEYGDAGDAHIIRPLRSQDELEAATMRAIFGEVLTPESDCWDEWQAYLRLLHLDGELYFEGDPPIQWMRAYIVMEARK